MAKARGVTRFDYVLPRDRSLPPENQTTYQLKTLTYREKEETGGVAVGDGGAMMNGYAKARQRLNRGLLGWKNQQREDGSQVEFRAMAEGDRRWIPDDLMDLLGDDALEISNAIAEGAQLPEALAKNS